MSQKKGTYGISPDMPPAGDERDKDDFHARVQALRERVRVCGLDLFEEAALLVRATLQCQRLPGLEHKIFGRYGPEYIDALERLVEELEEGR